ncbi:unnamed protein product [Urochloa humidicola]
MSSPEVSPPPPPAGSAPTTITALNDDLLSEIFLHLPSVTSLAHAAFSCHTFLHVVGSSSSFRRHFRDLHTPPLIAFFLVPYMDVLVSTAVGKRSSDVTP